MKYSSINPKAENTRIRELYESAFPEEERIHWDDLMRLAVELPLDFTVYYSDEGNFIGFTIMMGRKPISWFWYFAVVENERGKGIGREILARLGDRYKDETYFMDIESPEQADAPNPEQRSRRTEFYLRNGFQMTDVHWSYDPIDYAILIKGNAPHSQQDFDNIKAELWQHWQPKE